MDVDFWHACLNALYLENGKEPVARGRVNYNASRILQIEQAIRDRGQLKLQVRRLP
jgi:hypothetical protein